MIGGTARAAGLEILPGASVTVVLTGERDYGDAPRLRAVLDSLTADPAHGPIHIDAADLSFCDSSILGEFVRAHQKLSARAGRLTLIRPHPNIRSYVELTGLAPFLLTDPQAHSTPALPPP